MSELGSKIKCRRKELGLTLEKIAQKIGVSKQTVQRYESGVISNVPSDKIEKIAEVLDTTPAYLMGWDEFEACDRLIDEYLNYELNLIDLLEDNGYTCTILGKENIVHIRKDDFQHTYDLNDLVPEYIQLIKPENIISKILDISEEKNISVIEEIFKRLNNNGQKEAIKQSENLTYNPKYSNLIEFKPQKKKEDPYTVIAAHNDNEDPDQYDLMMQDAADLLEDD